MAAAQIAGACNEFWELRGDGGSSGSGINSASSAEKVAGDDAPAPPFERHGSGVATQWSPTPKLKPSKSASWSATPHAVDNAAADCCG